MNLQDFIPIKRIDLIWLGFVNLLIGAFIGESLVKQIYPMVLLGITFSIVWNFLVIKAGGKESWK